jgi:TetR/AcrR family transcriptional regulator, cholesterol catabolism regulator
MISKEAAGGRRERRRLETRTRLYEAAVELFAEKGYDATTMDEIAERADTARATVFNYFARKDEFLGEWALRRRRSLDARFEHEHPDGEPLDRCLLHFADILADINGRERTITRIVVAGWLSSTGPSNSGPFSAEASRSLLSCIERGRAGGEIKADVGSEAATRLLMDTYLGVLCRWVREEPLFDLRAELHDAVRMVTGGICA